MQPELGKTAVSKKIFLQMFVVFVLMSLERHYTMKEASRILGVSVRRLQIWDKLPVYCPICGEINEPNGHVFKCGCGLQADRHLTAAWNIASNPMWGASPLPRKPSMNR
ncbi:MAG: hypothetical protein ACTSYT_05095 [Candidatus Asgardarchaeia archaeon]